MQFPQNDTLAVIFSFLSIANIKEIKPYLVCKEWQNVLYTLTHAWPIKFNLKNMRRYALKPTLFNWTGIKSLSLPMMLDIDNTFSIRFPRLESLEVSASNITSESMSYLPKTLTKLLLNSCYIRDNALKFLPKTITHLRISYCNYFDELSATHLSESHLTNLIIEYPNISNHLLLCFPKTLTHLQLNTIYHNNDFIDKLPQTLTHLYLQNIEFTKDDLSSLPKLLTKLKLSYCKIPDDIQIDYAPKKITDLNIISCCITSIGLSNISQLPALKRMIVYDCLYIEDTNIKN